MTNPKKIAAEAAVKLIDNGMRVGLGTGSTTAFFIEALGKKCAQGLKIQTIASSINSEELAKKHQIPLLDPQSIDRLDIVVDGADEVDPNFNLTKGGGGALLREKLLASMTNQMVVIADESKLVDALGKFPLAIEIVPFVHQTTIQRLLEAGYSGKLRENFFSDNHNLIFDLNLPYPCKNPESHNKKIKQITGVVETGLFTNLATHTLVGYHNGKTKLKKIVP